MIWPIPMKVYIVTLYKHEDLEQFYDEMKSNNFHLVMKRPMSRNTHYNMTEEQAEKLRQDPRVWAVELPIEERGGVIERCAINYSPYNVSPNGFRKAGSSLSPNDTNWGLKHHGDESVALSQKGTWGEGNLENYTGVNVDIFNDGKHVDVIICDDPVAYDCDEWLSPTTGQTRFVQYDWYTELNNLVSSIDDDGQTLPTAPYSNYFDNASSTEYHGTHVCGTVAGQFYGWAREANIYSMQVIPNTANQGTPVNNLLTFDYLRAFHRNKPVNPDTGIKNPTVTNHSWASILNMSNFSPFDGQQFLNFSDITAIRYRGALYNSSNPNPSGWDFAGLEKDFGITNSIRFNLDRPDLNADIEDAIADGIVVVAASGNLNTHCVSDGDPDYSNEIFFNGLNITGTGSTGGHFYNRGSSPASSPNTIVVGSLSNHVDLHRASYSNFGPMIDIFAAGNYIISAFNNAGLADSKYGGAPNYFYPIQGTSMASPQVAGVLACVATGKERFTQGFAKRYLQETSASGQMDFDVNIGGGNTGSTSIYDITVTNSGFSYVVNGFDENGFLNGTQLTVTLTVGDTINFNLSNVQSNHPFHIRDFSNGPDVSTPAASGQGSTGTATVSWTPNTAGNYVYQCNFHPSMLGNIVVNSLPSVVGTFADITCSKGSPNLSLIGKNIREGLTGMISEQINNRNFKQYRTNGGLMYPRVPLFNRPQPKAVSKTLTLGVTFTWSSIIGGVRVYVINGSDRATTHVDAQNAQININQGDTLVFNVSATGHPFWIKTTPSSGGSNAVTTGTITNNGQQSSNLTWDTIGVTPGTYYYVCSIHWTSMQGQIIIT